MTKKNIFDGLKCPNCANNTRFNISLQTTVNDDGVIKWDQIMQDPRTIMKCVFCDKSGYVSYFTDKPKPIGWPFLVHVVVSGASGGDQVVKVAVQIPRTELDTDTLSDPNRYRAKILQYLPSVITDLGPIVFVEQLHAVLDLPQEEH